MIVRPHNAKNAYCVGAQGVFSVFYLTSMLLLPLCPENSAEYAHWTVAIPLLYVPFLLTNISKSTVNVPLRNTSKKKSAEASCMAT